MNGVPANLEQERLCPSCGYDLRASTSGRCPECGAEVGRGVFSRIPWVHRRYRGARRAFFATVMMVMIRPARLAAEARGHLDLRTARGFEREALVLATVLTTAMFTLAFLIHGPRFERWIFPAPAWAAGSRGPLVSPLFVLADGLWAIAPMLITIWLALHATMGIFRLMLWRAALRNGAPWQQRRAAVIGRYAAGMMPVAGFFGGTGLITTTAAFDLVLDIHPYWQLLLQVAVAVFFVASFASVVYPAAGLLRGFGLRWHRAIPAAIAFATLQVGVWLLIGAMVFWVAGFLTVCVWSMLH